MKIVYINSFYAPHEVGGAEKSVRFLAEAMVQQGHEACVITLGPKRDTTALNGVRIEHLPIANIYDPLTPKHNPAWKKLLWHGIDSHNPWAAKAVAEVLKSWRPDVAHTNNVSGFSVAVWHQLAALAVPIVHSLRDYYLLCPNTAMFKHGQPCEARCTQCRILGTPRANATKLVRTVIGNSHFILNKHKSYGLFANASSDVIYNAYSPAKHEPKPALTTGLRLGYIGRIAPTKGIETLIDAVQLATSTGVDLDVAIAGDGDEAYVTQLQQRAQDLPIRFLGRVKPEDFYTQIDWTVMPSLWDEPLARVIFESFCHGVPVMGSTTGGTPELVTEGQNGYLFAPGDARKLADIIAQAARSTDLKTRWQHACLAGADIFAPSYVCERYMNAYQQATMPRQA